MGCPEARRERLPKPSTITDRSTTEAATAPALSRVRAISTAASNTVMPTPEASTAAATAAEIRPRPAARAQARALTTIIAPRSWITVATCAAARASS